MDDQNLQPASKELIDLILAGRKIEAIKLYCETTGASLKEGKEAIESLQAELAEAHPELRKTKTGCGVTSVIMVTGTLWFLIERMTG